MKTIIIVANSDKDHYKLVSDIAHTGLLGEIDVTTYLADGKGSKEKREALRIMNAYAVTQLPFVLIADEDKEYAAVYSEEGPITISRIKDKI